MFNSPRRHHFFNSLADDHHPRRLCPHRIPTKPSPKVIVQIWCQYALMQLNWGWDGLICHQYPIASV